METSDHAAILWQTQTGAAFAIAAALIGAAAVLRQTSATERRADERRERRAIALRAVLPVMLSEMTDYTVRCAEIFAEVLDPPNAASLAAAGAPWQWPAGQSLPPVPVGFVEQLVDLIEAIPRDHAPLLVLLIRRLQIQHSRARGLQQDILNLNSPGHRGNIVVRANVVHCLIDALEVQGRCAALFVYADGTASSRSATADDVQRAAFLTVPARFLDDISEEIDRLAATGTWPKA